MNSCLKCLARVKNEKIISQAWLKWIPLLREYKSIHGDTNIRDREKFKGKNLGKWLLNQRTYANKGTLSTEKMRILNNIDQAWRSIDDKRRLENSDAHQQKWLRWLSLLEEYKSIHGDINIGNKEEFKGQKLGIWLCNQRTFANEGTLSPERCQLLNDISTTWRIKEDNRKTAVKKQAKLRDTTKEMLQLLKEYKQIHGHIRVKNSEIYKNKKIGQFLKSLKHRYKNGILHRDIVELIDSIDGTYWREDKQKDKFNAYLDLLYRYKEIHGNVSVKHDEKFKGINLGAWLESQKTLFIRGVLDQEKSDKLNKLDNNWLGIEK